MQDEFGKIINRCFDEYRKINCCNPQRNHERCSLYIKGSRPCKNKSSLYNCFDEFTKKPGLLVNCLKGKNLPKINSLNTICDFFQISPDVFFPELLDNKVLNGGNTKINDDDVLNLCGTYYVYRKSPNYTSVSIQDSQIKGLRIGVLSIVPSFSSRIAGHNSLKAFICFKHFRNETNTSDPLLKKFISVFESKFLYEYLTEMYFYDIDCINEYKKLGSIYYGGNVSINHNGLFFDLPCINEFDKISIFMPNTFQPILESNNHRWKGGCGMMLSVSFDEQENEESIFRRKIVNEKIFISRKNIFTYNKKEKINIIDRYFKEDNGKIENKDQIKFDKIISS
ncbi:MAG: hypothetical protein FWC41_05460 [Firmicutes bacterium]|nr:hypothetical protein [Bacillota bacterium]